MYWIGGSGDINDGAHWSYTPGGSPANVAPGASANLVFQGNGSSEPELRVYFDQQVKINSLSIQTHAKILFVKKLSPARLVISRNFDNPLDNVNFQTEVTFEFSNDLAGSQYGTIATGEARLSANMVISSGKWRIGRMYLDEQHGLYVRNADVHFYYSVMELGHLDLLNCGFLNFDHTHLKVKNETKVKNCSQYSFKRAYLNWKMYDDSKPVEDGLNALALSKGSQNQINSLCIPTPTVDRATCSPGCDGVVYITLPPASCYTPSVPQPYSILITNGTCTNSIPSNVLFVGPGTYTINNFCSCTADYIFYIVDGNGDDVESVTVPVPIPSAYANQSPGATTLLNCNGVCSGSVNLTYNGVAPFSFTITPPTGPQVFTTSPTAALSVSNVCAGTLSVFVQDAQFCTSTFVRNFVWPAALNTNSVFTNISCNGVCNGSLTISPTGGTAGYTVAFNPGSTFAIGSGATVASNNLCPGVITVTVTDTKSCTATTSATVINPPLLTMAVSQNSLPCNSICNGSATLTIGGGTPNYAYTVTPSLGAPITGSTSLTSVVVNSLCGGSYTVTLRDSKLCSLTSTFFIAQPPAVTVTPTFTNITCNGNCNGAINIAVSGGNGGPHTYTWLPVGSFGGASNVSSLTSLCANAYTINVQDVANCTSSVVISLTQPTVLALTTATQALSCFGTCTGSGTVTATGGNPGPYTYTWSPNPPAGQGTSVISSLCGGSAFTVTVRDVSLCAATATLGILPAPSFTPNITSQTVTCAGVCNGSIGAAPTGTSTFNYTLASTAAGFTTTANPPYINLCGGIYTLSMQNTATGCIQSFTVNVAQPNALSGTVNNTSITCTGFCDGSAAAVISGGTPTYAVSWVTPLSATLTGNSLTNICAGTYTLHITDANGCTNNTITTTLIAPAALATTVNMTPASCNGNCDGALAAVVAGGVPPYSISWSDGSVSNPNTNLCAGAYNLIVTDNNGCATIASTNVTQPAAITIAANVTSVNCSGGFTGSSTVTASGGTPIFSYEFNNVPPGAPIATNTTGVLGGLQQGNYLVTATDANSCSQGILFTISSPALLSASIVNKVNSCNVCTGAATVQAVGGATPYVTYVWTNSVGTTVSTGSTASALCPGNYTVTVTDNNGCITTQTVNIALTVNISVVANGSGVPCFGNCTGFAVANPSGGAGGYTYNWTPGGQNTPTATGLCAGAYVVTVTDLVGCVGTGTVTITQPASLTAVATQTNATCTGSCNGAISATVAGGTGPFTYSWTPAAPSTSIQTSLCAGLYTLLVRDNNLCTASLPVFTITQNPPVTGTFTTQNPSACIANNGSICVGGGGGVGPYQYTWTPSGNNSTCLTGLTGGVYPVIIRDAAGCTTTLFPALINPAGPTLAVVPQSVTCFGGNNGGAVVTASGVSPFSFSWTPASSTSSTGTSITASGLTTGTYVVSAADNNSCITTQSIVIAGPPQMSVNASVFNVTCNGSGNGSISVNPTGGTPGYNYAWSPGALPNSSLVTNLSPNIYTLVVSDSKPCSQTFTFQITQPTPLTVSTTSVNVRCNGACNGTITATAAGGLGPVSYSWLPAGAFTGSATATILNLCPNSYTVVASNPNCSVSTVVVITEPPALTSTLILKNATCSNSCNAIATHSVAGGVPGYNYGWSSSPSTASVLTGLCAGNYVASASDGNGCIITKTFAVVPPANFTLNLAASNPLCNAACNGSIATTPIGAQGNINYAWTPTGSGQNPTGLCFGNYNVIATDDSLCVASAVITLTNPPAILANVATTDPSCFGLCNGSATSTPVNAVGAVSYAWNPPAANQPNVSALCAGPHSVTVTDGNGCQVLQTFTINAPTQLTVNPASNPATCGQPNGTVFVNVLGGTPVYTYTWLPPATGNSSVITNVGAGVYSVVVADQGNCTNTVSIILSNSNGPGFVPITTTSVACNGDCTGAASVNIAGITGGTPNYTLAWLPPAPASTNVVNNLCAGVYVLQVTDANACVLFTNVPIAEPPAVNISPSFGLPSCMGTCDGSISLNATGGLGSGFTYTWLPSGPPNNPVLTNACAGTYNVLIGDNGNNCVYTQTVVLPSQLNITVSTSITPNQCVGDCNGSATAFNPQGGVPPYTYNWSNGQIGPVATNMCTGTYTLIITDGNGCFTPIPVTINALSQIVNTVSITSPSCGLCNGASTISTSGGAAPYSYTWTTGSNVTAVTNLCSGIYQVIVRDALSCQVTETVIVNNSTGITGETFSVTPLPCAGGCNASASVTAQGGNAPITYNWVSPAATGSVIGGLCVGTYFVQMTDANGCVRTASVDIQPVVSLSLTAFVNPPGCGLNDGSISVDIAGGNLPYSVSWNPPAGSSATLTNIGQGSYTITVTEGSPNACVSTQVFNVSNTSGPVLAATQTNIDCFNACTGAINITASGSPGPYSYSWSNGGSTSSLTGLCKGAITVTVTDNTTNCVTVRTFTITDNPQIQAGLPTITPPSCGLCNGAANLNIFGGSPAYSYTWTTGANSPGVSNLCAGLYQVVVRDVLGCQVTQTVIINNSSTITGENFTVQPLSCGGSCDGAATVTAIGGNPPLTYNWINPAVTGSVSNNLCAGVYFVQMTDAQNCLRTASVNISPINVFTVTSSVTPPGCGLADGVLSVSVTGGVMPYTYSWTPPAANTPVLTNIPQGTYTLSITDASTNTCAQSQQFNVSNTTGPVLTAVQNNVRCFGTCTGSLGLSASGSPGPFSFNWSNGATTASVTNLCMGVITVTVTDNTTNCVTIQSFTITENPQIQAGLPTVTQPSCGLCNGAVSLNVFGGSPAYTYTWSTGATGPASSNLCAGIYQVNVQDVLGCQVTQTVILNNSNGIAGESFSVQGLPCAGTCDGSATVAAVGGNGNITYTWLNPVTNGPVIGNLCAGDYFVQMQDQQGCLRTASVSVNAVTTLSLAYTVVEPGCQLSNGSVEVLISGGTPSYAISWQPVANTTATLSNIGQGSYTVTVTESGPNACVLTQVVQVSNLNAPLVTATQTDVACFGACSGVIAAVANGTSAPFSYNWSIGGNAQTVTNLCPSVITLSVTDANNCVAIESYTINENPPLQTGVPQISAPLCNQCNGLATVNVFGGSLPYNIVWSNGGLGASTQSLCAGLYQVQITDAAGCLATGNVVINNPAGVTGENFSIQDEVCGGTCNGGATVTAVGGTSPITYNWINPVSAGPVLNNLCPGDYFVQMTDGQGCIRTSSVSVGSTPDFSFTPTVVLPDCGQSNGSIGVTVTGGTLPYSFSWSPMGTTTPSLNNVGPGTYSLQITDGSGCSKTQLFTMSSATAPAVTFTQSNINCFGACTGSVAVVATGSLAPFTYSWSTGSTAPVVTDLCAGLITLTVTSSDACVNIRSFTLTENPELTLSLPNLLSPACFGNCNGGITLVPSGGVLPYTFNWQPIGQSGNPITGICAGLYSVAVTDSKGCVQNSTVSLNNPAAITVTTVTKNSSCSSVADGSLGVTVLGGTPSYTFAWAGPGGFTANTPSLSALLAGTYTLNILDRAGCSGDTVLTLAPTISVSANAGADATLCAGNDVVLSATLSTGSVGYGWYLLPNTTTTLSTQPVLTAPVAAGSASYMVVATSSVTGCFDRDTVVINAYPELIVDAGPDVLIPVFATVTIGGNPTSFSAVSLTWSPASGLSDSSVPNPVASNTITTIYTITAVDANGCTATDSIKVELYPEVKIPNGFSPNGDGKNDVWVIDHIEQFPQATIEVYNRWGELLFQSTGYQTPFNGKFRGKDLPVGTYYYIIHLNHPAYTTPFTGPLTIFR